MNAAGFVAGFDLVLVKLHWLLKRKIRPVLRFLLRRLMLKGFKYFVGVFV